MNTERALIPIKVSFPDMMSDGDDLSQVRMKIQQVISLIYGKLSELGLASTVEALNHALKPYGISIQKSRKG